MNKEYLRNKYREIRRNINLKDKAKFDKDIFNQITSLNEYIDSNTVLTYISLKDEVDTLKIIEYSLNAGKKIAVPKCIGKEMKFYYIDHINNLEEGYFGILEPVISRNNNNNKEVINFNNSICIVPGICFDKEGNRVGYGGGYYDRFLSKYSGIKIGLTYKECICEKIETDKYDIKVDKTISNY